MFLKYYPTFKIDSDTPRANEFSLKIFFFLFKKGSNPCSHPFLRDFTYNSNVLSFFNHMCVFLE